MKGYTYFGENDVLLAKITPCMENGKCAIARHLKNGVGFGSTEFHVIRSGAEVIPEWVHYFLKQESTRKEAERHMTGSAGQKRVPAAFLEELPIPLPPLPEQRRIAAILDKADRLRRLRRFSLQLSDNYLQSVFLQMFCTAEDAYWPRVIIEVLAKDTLGSIRTGPFGSQLLHSEFVEDGVPVLGIDNAVQNRFVWSERRFITPQKYEQLKRYTVHPGDVVITIMGTTGRCAVLPDPFPTAINSKHLCCITLNLQKCLPQYLQWCFLTHPSVLQELGVSERGAVMPGLNMEIIKNLVVPVPPLPLQQ
ncbi:MAG: restriction endonuclease subunit S, partial [Chloroflexota bacterium]|nr:restriction endonuclease subunit S [Chloroflexota bacterium]